MAAAGGSGSGSGAGAAPVAGAAESASAATATEVPAVDVAGLCFDYGAATDHAPILKDVTFSLPRGSRMLLVGDNGAGKSTLLRVLAGRHIHRDDAVKVFGKNAFYDTSLNMERAFLASDWGRRTVAFTGHGCALQADVAVESMMVDAQKAYPARRDFLVRLLGVDVTWRMHQLSDGQRRRVQLMLQLLRPSRLLLLDEITTDLDLLTRQDFLDYLKADSEEHGTTIIYATHIFDGLEGWGTHIGYVTDRTLRNFSRLDACPAYCAARAAGGGTPLFATVAAWLRADRDARRAAGIATTEAAEHAGADELRGKVGNGYLPGRFSMGYN